MGVALCKPDSHALRMCTNVRPMALCRCNKLDSFRHLRVRACSAGGAVASRECHGEAAHDGTVYVCAYMDMRMGRGTARPQAVALAAVVAAALWGEGQFSSQ